MRQQLFSQLPVNTSRFQYFHFDCGKKIGACLYSLLVISQSVFPHSLFVPTFLHRLFCTMFVIFCRYFPYLFVLVARDLALCQVSRGERLSLFSLRTLAL
jgi:hypothetical protein